MHRDKNKQAEMGLIFMNINLSKGDLLEDGGSQTIRLCVCIVVGVEVLLELRTNGRIWNIRRQLGARQVLSY